MIMSKSEVFWQRLDALLERSEIVIDSVKTVATVWLSIEGGRRKCQDVVRLYKLFYFIVYIHI